MLYDNHITYFFTCLFEVLYRKKRRKLIVRFLLMFIFICIVSSGSAEPVLIYGKTFTGSAEFRERLLSKGFQLRLLTLEELKNVSVKQGHLLILATDTSIHPDIRRTIDKYLQTGGNIILAGEKGFDYSPVPVLPVSLVNFEQPETYTVVHPQRKMKFGSLEKERIEVISSGSNKKALEFSTKHRGMRDVMLETSLKGKRSSFRSVITFRAKGNAYMDLMALEILDVQGRKWYNFTSITPEWKEYAVSLADFIPENWTNENDAYPLLRPENIDTLRMGVNLITVWREKPMYFAVADICLAENASRFYTPTSALKRMKVPYLENDIKIPQWLFDPMFQGQSLSGERVIFRREEFPFGDYEIKKADSLFSLAKMLSPQPGARMGTDCMKSYDLREEREKRMIPVFQTGGKHGERLHDIARLDLYAGGRYAGAAIGLFGITPRKIVSHPQIQNALIECVCFILRNPVIMAVRMNTTTAETRKHEISPLLKVILKNPSSRPVKGKVLVNIANEKLKGKLDVKIPAQSILEKEIKLDQVPFDFPIHKYNWRVSFESKQKKDFWDDSVNVERTMLLSFKYLINAQKHYPDGRFSHHYFGDAYGVRAMLAYCNVLEKQSGHLQRNQDVWKTISPDDIKNAAFRFCDMLVEKQTSEGALPMGYAEHSRGYNVADGGQIGLSLVQSAQYISDQERRDRYLELAYRFADWAEEFYIDSARSEVLALLEPEEYAKGNAFTGMYGLGKYGNKKKLTGPSWVVADILALQICLASIKEDPRSEKYIKIAKRNIKFYVNAMYSATGYYQAEALFWAWMHSSDKFVRAKIEKNLKTTFIPNLLKGVENEMFKLGGRRTLNALPLLYYQRHIENNAGVRAALLKYVWTAGSESSLSAIGHHSEIFPKPVHGESLASIKYVALSALWCMEILFPGSTLLLSN